MIESCKHLEDLRSKDYSVLESALTFKQTIEGLKQV